MCVIDCEKSLFFFRFSEGSACAVSVEWRGGETRERGPLPSRAWSFACLALFSRWTKKKEILLIVYVCEVELGPVPLLFTLYMRAFRVKTIQNSVNIA